MLKKIRKKAEKIPHLIRSPKEIPWSARLGALATLSIGASILVPSYSVAEILLAFTALGLVAGALFSGIFLEAGIIIKIETNDTKTNNT